MAPALRLDSGFRRNDDIYLMAFYFPRLGGESRDRVV
jgi:hypothetical protein